MPHKYLLAVVLILLCSTQSKRLSGSKKTQKPQQAHTTTLIASKQTVAPIKKQDEGSVKTVSPTKKQDEVSVKTVAPIKKQDEGSVKTVSPTKKQDEGSVKTAKGSAKTAKGSVKTDKGTTIAKNSQEDQMKNTVLKDEETEDQKEEETEDEEKELVNNMNKLRRQKKVGSQESAVAEGGGSWFWVMFLVYLGVFGAFCWAFKHLYFPQQTILEMFIDIMIIVNNLIRRKRQHYQAPKQHQDIDDAQSIEVGYSEEQGRKLFWEKSSVEGI